MGGVGGLSAFNPLHSPLTFTFLIIRLTRASVEGCASPPKYHLYDVVEYDTHTSRSDGGRVPVHYVNVVCIRSDIGRDVEDEKPTNTKAACCECVWDGVDESGCPSATGAAVGPIVYSHHLNSKPPSLVVCI